MTQPVRTPWMAVLMAAALLACAGVATAAEAPLRLVSVTGSGEVQGPTRHGLRDPGGRGAQAHAGRGPDGGQRHGRAGPGPDPRTEDRPEVRRLDAAAGAARLPLGREGVEAGAARATSSAGRSRWKCATSTASGTLLEKSVSAGVNQLGGARLDSSRRKELEREALTQSGRRRPPECGYAGPRGRRQARSGTEPERQRERCRCRCIAARDGMVAAAPMADAAEQSYQPSEMKFTASVSAQFELLVP